MIKIKVIVVEDDLLGKGENTILDIEVKRTFDLGLGITFAQALVKKAENVGKERT